MKTRVEIHKRLNQYLANELTDVLQSPLVPAVKIYSKKAESRLDIRTACDEKTLSSWYTQPMYILATPKKDHTLLQVEIQPQRWPKDLGAYTKACEDIVNETVEKINVLSSANFTVSKEAVARQKGKDKYMQSIKIVLRFDDEITELNNLKQIRDFLADLALINNDFAVKLTAKKAELFSDEAEDNSIDDFDAHNSPEEGFYLFIETHIRVYEKYDNLDEAFDEISLETKDLIEDKFGVGEVVYFYKFGDQDDIDVEEECIHSLWSKIEIEHEPDELIWEYEEAFMEISDSVGGITRAFVICKNEFNENEFDKMSQDETFDYMYETSDERYQSYAEGDYDEGNYM